MAIRNLSNLLIRAISMVIFAICLILFNAGLAEASTILYYGQSYSPYEMRFTYSSQEKTVFTSVNGTIKPVALDSSHGKLYFADPLEGVIYQSKLTGSSTTPYLSGVYAEGLAVDADSNFFYYTQSHTDDSNIEHYNVVRANLTNPLNSPTVLYTTETGTPEAITVAENGDVYFSDPHESVAAIYKVASGTSNPVAFMTDVHAYGLAVQGEFLYFSEAYDPNFKIRKVKLSDKSVSDFVYVSSTGAPKALTIAGSDLYVADMHSSVAKIYKINLVSQAQSVELSNVNAGGIAVLINTPPLVTVNTGISTNENTPVVISNTELQTTDTQTTEPGELVYKLLTVPGKGKLTIDGTEMAVNAEFTQSDINNSMIRYVPSPTENGNDSFTFNVNDGMGEYVTGTNTFNITINAANSAPTFIKGADQTILEDAGPQTIVGWATAMSVGPADESDQTYEFSCSNDNNSLFTEQPRVAHNGTLTYTPAADAYGIATVTVTMTDSGDTANGGKNSTAQTFTITITGINEAPSFTGGTNQTVLEDAGPQTIAGWASGISAGPMENDQTLVFSVSSDNNSLFSVKPAISANGTLTYTTASNVYGSATVTVTLKDNGGTDNGGADTSSSQQFTITVTAVNDAPTFTKGANQTIAEGAGEQTVKWATAMSVGPANESGQTYDFITTNDNNSLFTEQPRVAHDGTLTYTPASNAYGSATVTVTMKDNGGTLNGGVDTSSQSFVISVTSVNDPPAIIVPGPQSILEDNALTFAGANTISIADSDAGSNPIELGITVDIGALSLNGTNGLSFSSGDGSADSTMLFTGTLENINQALNGMIYIPASNYSGSAILTINVNDQGNTGDGGELTDSNTVNIAIASVNDAPTLDAIADLTLPNNPGQQTVNLTGISPGGGEDQNLTLTAASNNPSMIPDISVNYTSPDATGSLTFTPVKSGTAMITVLLKDDGNNTNGGVNTQTIRFSVAVGGSHSGGGGSSGTSSERPKLDNPPVIDLTNDMDSTASLAPKPVNNLVSGNQALIVKNQGITVEFPPQSLMGPELEDAIKETGSVLEIKVRAISETEKAKLLELAPLGQSTGIFELGGTIFDLSSQFTTPAANGTNNTVKIASFPEPVAVTIDLSSWGELSPAQIAGLTGVRFEKDDSGKITMVKLGGTYNPVTKAFTFYTDRFSLYGVLRAENLVNINLVLNTTTATVNGSSKALDVGPILINDRTMVPFRFIGEAFGAKVDWLADTRTVVIILDNKEMRLTVDEKVPGLDVSPVIVQGRTLVPIRYISENLGAYVKWFPSSRKIEIVK